MSRIASTLPDVRRALIAAATAIGLVVIGGCSADQGDFKTQAEKLIKSDLRVEQSTGTTFTKAECAPPKSTKVGTQYSCVAIAVDGSTWDFSVKIQSKNTIFIDDYKQRT